MQHTCLNNPRISQDCFACHVTHMQNNECPKHPHSKDNEKALLIRSLISSFKAIPSPLNSVLSEQMMMNVILTEDYLRLLRNKNAEDEKILLDGIQLIIEGNELIKESLKPNNTDAMIKLKKFTERAYHHMQDMDNKYPDQAPPSWPTAKRIGYWALGITVATLFFAITIASIVCPTLLPIAGLIWAQALAGLCAAPMALGSLMASGFFGAHFIKIVDKIDNKISMRLSLSRIHANYSVSMFTIAKNIEENNHNVKSARK